MIKYISNYLDSLSNRQCIKLTLVSCLILGVVDFLIGPELSFSVFYTGPIMLAAWYGGKWVGALVAVVSSIIWLIADLAAGVPYSSWVVPIWNALIRLLFFGIILWLLLIVREKLQMEESLADTDPLTGLANRRFFMEQLERECIRVQRYPEPFTIAYFDLDNFKYVNDSMGHDVGDRLLERVAVALAANVRGSDLAARLGGDEFAVLFTHLEDKSAQTVLENLQQELLSAMQSHDWPVTFSIGAITFEKVTESSRDMIKKVDDLMYQVKKSGKNNIRHLTMPESD